MQTRTFPLRAAQITVHRATVRDRLMTDVLSFRYSVWRNEMQAIMNAEGTETPSIMLVPETAENYFISVFWRIVNQSQVEGDLGFEWFPNTAPMSDLMRALDGLLALPAQDYDLWIKELNQIDLNIGTTDILKPGEGEKKAEQHSQTSQTGSTREGNENT